MNPHPLLEPSNVLRFQITYEELKHKIPVNQLYGNSGFQITYEELKLDDAPLFNQIVTCFQITYEELKPNGRVNEKTYAL